MKNAPQYCSNVLTKFNRKLGGTTSALLIPLWTRLRQGPIMSASSVPKRLSRCGQATNVMKNAPQYCSDVLMKFNCKLGSATSALRISLSTRLRHGPNMNAGATPKRLELR